MPTTNSNPFISASLPEAVTTNVATESPVTRDYGREDAARDAWQNLIDDQLIEWGRDPSQLDDEGTEAPSKDTIQLAIWLAGTLSQRGLPAPTRIVPDAHGGIVFELEGKNVFESIRISPDANVEYCAFQNCRLVEREPWVLQIIDSE